MSGQKIIVVLGKTATGKSDLAVRLARRFGGEVISADSRQVYKGLNLGTGKITKKETRGIKHHLIDVVSPKKQFSVSEYQKLVNSAIKDILGRGKLPIICGGTGLYIDSVVNGVVLPEVRQNIKLRRGLEKIKTDELVKILKGLDPTRAKNIDVKNRPRLVRAIEIAVTLGKIPKIKTKTPEYEFLKIGLDLPAEELQQKIHKRLLARIKKGMIAEVRKLNKNGVSWKRLEALGLEYRYLALYLQKKITKQEMLSKLETEIWRYSKRQNTWFKRDKEIKWFKPTEFKKTEKETKKFLN